MLSSVMSREPVTFCMTSAVLCMTSAVLLRKAVTAGVTAAVEGVVAAVVEDGSDALFIVGVMSVSCPTVDAKIDRL